MAASGEQGGKILQFPMVERPDPHLVVPCSDGHVHVYPEAYIGGLLAGLYGFESVPACVLRAILREWLDSTAQLEVQG